MRGSVPSGRTTHASAARASSTSWKRKAAGLSRRDRDGAGQRLQPGRVQRIGDAVDHALDPFQVVDRQSRVEVTHPRRGLVTVVVDDENGQAGGARGPGELPYPRVRLDPGGQEQGGQPGPVERGEAGGHDHVVAVSGDHDEPALGEHAEAAGDALGEHRHLLDTPGQVALVEDPRVQLADQVADPQPGQLGAVRHRGDEAEPALGPAPRPAGLPPTDPCRRHAVDHAADHACVLTRPVPAGRDGERLGQKLDSPAAGSGPGSAARSARSSPLSAPAAGQLAASRTSASSALASAWLSPLAYSLAGPGLSPSTTTTSDRSWTGCQAATIFSSTASSPPDPSCCSSWAVDSGSGGRSAVMAATSAIERSGPPSARGWATGLTKATFTPRRSRARTRPRQVLARLAPAAVGTTSKVRP